VLEDSRLRAVAIMDLVFLVHIMFVMLIVVVNYTIVAKTLGIWGSLGSY
jgi:hypothetical protein